MIGRSTDVSAYLVRPFGNSLGKNCTKMFTLLTARSNYLDKRDYYGGYAS